MDKQEQNTSYKSKSKPESRSRLGFFIFITVLVTSLVVGGTIYAWQKKELNSLRKRKTKRIEELESQVNELNTKINNLKEPSESKTESIPADWKFKKTEELEYRYPETVDGNYINVSSQDWPPRVIVKNAKTEELICEPGEEKQNLTGQKYCFNKSLEGTAGTTYKRYSWRTIRHGRRINLIFSLKFPSCGALPEFKKCQQAQNEFEPAELADKLFSSISILN